MSIEYDNLEMIKLLLSDERVDPNVLNIINWMHLELKIKFFNDIINTIIECYPQTKYSIRSKLQS